MNDQWAVIHDQSVRETSLGATILRTRGGGKGKPQGAGSPKPAGPTTTVPRG